MRSLVGVAVALLALVPACGDDDSGNPGEFVALGDFDTAYKDAECTYLVRCGFFADKATCLAATLQTSGTMFNLSAQTRAEIFAGRVSYNGNHVKACFDALANATCDKTDENGRIIPIECYDFTHGTIAGGAACMTDIDCVSGFCNSNGTSQCSGTCVGDTAPSKVPGGLGENCSSVVGCAAGLYCDNSMFKCATLKASGDTCVNNNECAYGLGCAGTTTARTCKALPTADQPCPDGVCRDDGLHCVTVSTTMTCKTYGLAGATCTSSTDCSPYFPCDFSTTSPYMCKKPPSIGDACTSSNSRCFEEHSYCDSMTLKCVAGKPDGQMCTSAIQCNSGDCDFSTMLCVSPTPACN